MAAHILVLPYEGGLQGYNSKSNITKSTPKRVPFLWLPWFYACFPYLDHTELGPDTVIHTALLCNQP